MGPTALRLRDVTYKVYPDARHETLNEIHRDEVTNDLIAWLKPIIANAHSAKAAILSTARG